MAAQKNWGNCKGCRYFSSSNSNPSDTDVAKCKQSELQEFDLSVSGASGCNAFEARAGVAGGVYQEPAPGMH